MEILHKTSHKLNKGLIVGMMSLYSLIVNSFTNLICLHQGQEAYNGSPEKIDNFLSLSGNRCPINTSALEFIMTLLSGSGDSLTKRLQMCSDTGNNIWERKCHSANIDTNGFLIRETVIDEDSEYLHDSCAEGKTSILLIEPFYVGSHKQLVDLLHDNISDTHLVTLPGKKWQWKARTSALYLSQVIPFDHQYRTIFTSSVLNLAELTSLRPDLAGLHKVLYFHENQLVYPVRKQQDRDFQYGYNQILSCLVADVVLFNSKYNMDSFLSTIDSFLKLIPDNRPKGIAQQLDQKCHVLYFPIQFPIPFEENRDQCEKYIKNSPEIRHIVKSKANKGNAVCSDTSMDVANSIESMVSTDECMDTMIKADTEYIRPEENDDNDSSSIINPSNASKNKIAKLEEDSRLTLDTHSLEKSTCTGNNSNSVEMCNVDEDKVIKVENDCQALSDTYLPLNSDNSLMVTQTCTQLGEDSEMKGTVDKTSTATECEKTSVLPTVSQPHPVHIVWPHRWEHDKGPDAFFKVMNQLLDSGCDFRLSVLGETFTDVPAVFEESRQHLSEKVEHWGYLPSKQDYYAVLQSADCVISTANHEFFGVAMLEAVHLGCYPLCPNRLVYPEIFPKECLYNTDQQLFKRLREFCRKPYIVRSKQYKFETRKYAWRTLAEDFRRYLHVQICGSTGPL